jgi:hypothetical protein
MIVADGPLLAPFSLAFECYGARVGVSTNEATILDSLPEHLPVKSKLIDSSDLENQFTLLTNEMAGSPEGADKYSLYDGECLVLSTGDLGVALKQLARELDAVVALEASPWVFVHAGVVGWQAGAIVIPGRSMTGKTSLVAALVKAGATYYSDEYAVFDRQGYVHAFPKPLHLRTEQQGEPEKISAEKLGGRIGTSALPVTLIVATHYEAQARWGPKLLEPGQAVLRLFDNTVDALRRPEGAIDIFARAVAGCVAISGPRPSSEQVAPLLLALCDRINHDTALAEGSKLQGGLDLDPLSPNP